MTAQERRRFWLLYAVVLTVLLFVWYDIASAETTPAMTETVSLATSVVTHTCDVTVTAQTVYSEAATAAAFLSLDAITYTYAVVFSNSVTTPPTLRYNGTASCYDYANAVCPCINQSGCTCAGDWIAEYLACINGDWLVTATAVLTSQVDISVTDAVTVDFVYYGSGTVTPTVTADVICDESPSRVQCQYVENGDMLVPGTGWNTSGTVSFDNALVIQEIFGLEFPTRLGVATLAPGASIAGQVHIPWPAGAMWELYFDQVQENNVLLVEIGAAGAYSISVPSDLSPGTAGPAAFGGMTVYQGAVPLSGTVPVTLTNIADHDIGIDWFCMSGPANLCHIEPFYGWDAQTGWETAQEPVLGTDYGVVLGPGGEIASASAPGELLEGNYQAVVTGTASGPTTVAFVDSACGISETIEISGDFALTAFGHCAGYNAVERLANVGAYSVTLDHICFYEMPMCVPAGECYVENYTFTRGGDGAASSWDVSGSVEYSDTIDAVILEPAAQIAQEVCLPPGTYYAYVSVAGTSPSGSVYGAIEVDGHGYMFTTEGSSDFEPQMFYFEFEITELMNYHTLIIEHRGTDDVQGRPRDGEPGLIVYDVCLRRFDQEVDSCGLIRNSEFANTAPNRAEPWVVLTSTARFDGDMVTISPDAGVFQTIYQTATYTNPVTYTLEIYAQSANNSPADMQITVDSDQAAYTGDTELRNTGPGGWEEITSTIVLTGGEGLESITLAAGANPINVMHVCLWSGDMDDYPVPITDRVPLTESYNCSLCDLPRPAGCDTSYGSGTCEYYGKPAIAGFGDFVIHLSEVVSRWFDWGWCWLRCWFETLIEAIRGGIEPPDISIPGFSDLYCGIKCWFEKELAKLDWWRLQLTALTDWLDDLAGNLWEFMSGMWGVVTALFGLFGLLIVFTQQITAVVVTTYNAVLAVFSANPAAAEMDIWEDSCVFSIIDLMNWLIENSLLQWWFYIFMLFVVVETGIWLLEKLRSRSE